jgi:hypothetical protein
MQAHAAPLIQGLDLSQAQVPGGRSKYPVLWYPVNFSGLPA